MTGNKYTAVLYFTSESQLEIRAKSNCFKDMLEAQIMSPLTIHEALILWLVKQLNAYISQIDHNMACINVTFHGNHFSLDILHAPRDIIACDRMKLSVSSASFSNQNANSEAPV
ncbi:hypothetical protein BDR03DRAFT_986784 [Suillus americanus]|nr:hypothetical protein BDR03DRAFT_986784 [Suillus americanus]